MVATSTALRAAEVIKDSHLLLYEAAEPDRSEADVEEAVVDFLEADVLLGEQRADVDPVVEPADASISRHEPAFEVIRVCEWRQALWIGTP